MEPYTLFRAVARPRGSRARTPQDVEAHERPVSLLAHGVGDDELVGVASGLPMGLLAFQGSTTHSSTWRYIWRRRSRSARTQSS